VIGSAPVHIVAMQQIADTGNAATVLATLPANSVHTCVTSPPYWGLRDYGVRGQLGLEKTPEEYVASMVLLFQEVRRVLRDDGTLWLNLGDSYSGSGKGAMADGSDTGGEKQRTNQGTQLGRFHKTEAPGLKPKDLVGIPWRAAFALQQDGWYLCQDIIWYKPNPMPESVTDRCTKAHEYIFLLSKSARYYFDHSSIKEPSKYPDDNRKARSAVSNKRIPTTLIAGIRPGSKTYPERNRRSVWTVSTRPYRGAHFATFPRRSSSRASSQVRR
jgi:DNA modification methylase